MTYRRSLPVLLAGLMLAVIAWPTDAETFRNVEIGTPVPNLKLKTLAGTSATLLRKDRAVNVFFFFRPDQAHSLTLLDEIVTCQKSLAGKSVSWVGVVSDSYAVKDVKSVVQKAGLMTPVLVDKGDVLYGKIGVKLHPSVGLADKQGRLRAYEPFRELNYCDIIRARVRYLLGEINDAELAKVLTPPKATQGGDVARARRDLKLAAMMLKAGKLDKAYKMAHHAVEQDATSVDAQVMLATILAGQGKCKKALIHVNKALALDPEQAAAKALKKKCGGASNSKTKSKASPSAH